MQARYQYADILLTAERVAFRVEDVLPPDARFDFERPFLPESLARAASLPFLTARERLVLNQIRAHAYLSMFGTVEEFILPFVLDHARGALSEPPDRTRALLQFAGEEAKHIDLFKRFCARFERDFGTPCEVVGPAQVIARSVLSQGPLAVALTILQIEWMTQRHYLESIKSDEALDPQFRSLLKHHFLEECQHAKLDTLMALELAQPMQPSEIFASVGEYLGIVEAMDALLAQQVELDLRSFERATGRALDIEEAEALRAQQLGAARFTFLVSGMTHPHFLATLSTLAEAAPARVLEAAARLS